MLVTLPLFVRLIVTRGNVGAKFVLPANRVDPLADFTSWSPWSLGPRLEYFSNAGQQDVILCSLPYRGTPADPRQKAVNRSLADFQGLRYFPNR
jgi:hypothetical protein